MKTILFILLAGSLCGCSSSQSTVNTLPWDRREIAGHQFNLVATDKIEEISFAGDGSATATLGTKAAVAGPILSWHLDKSGVLTLKDGSTEIVLQKIAAKGNVVDVLRNGKPATYKLQ